MGVYTNPIIPGFNPDPSLVRVGADYFLVTSTFEYFPGVPIYHSQDLIRWELIGHALSRRSQLDIRTPEVGGGVWAPTIRFHDGVFYLTTACFDRYRPQADERVWPRGLYVKTANIWDSSTWTDPIYFDAIGFDQDLFWDTDSTVYLSTTRRLRTRTPTPSGAPPLKDFAVHTTPIDLATGRSLARPLVSRTSPSGVAEGAHLFRRGEWYYLLTAEGGTEGGHRAVVCRSRVGPLGPWEEGPGGLWAGGKGGEVERTGHADLVEGVGGEWWAVFLGVRSVVGEHGGASVFGRETFLVPVTWQHDWPLFNNGEPVALKSEAPGLYRLDDRSTAWRDDFAADDLQLGWYRKNTPVDGNDVALVPSANGNRVLRLYGSAYPLSSPACPTLLLRKQTLDRDPTMWRVKLGCFEPDAATVEAGAVVYWNHGTFASVGVRLGEGGKGRVVRFSGPVGEGQEVVEVSGVGEGAVVLVIRARAGWYELGFLEGEEEEGEQRVRWLGWVSKRVMTRDPDVGAAFTGMMFGVYAFGEMEPSLAPADFEYVECV